MDPIEYVSPAGFVQHVAAPAVAVRLKASGWRPRAELTAQAPRSKDAAAQLKRAEAAQRARGERSRQRRLAAPAGATEQDTPPPAPAREPEAKPRTSRTKKPAE